MKKNLHYSLWLLICMIILTGTGTVHAHDGCGFDAYHHAMMQDSAYASNYHVQQQVITNYLNTHNNPNARITPGGCDKPLDMVVTMPVVMHYVGESATDTVTLQAAQAVLDKLNSDFANSAGFGPDTKIRFVFAKRDPNGNPTTGLRYINGSQQWPNYVQYGVNYITGNGVTSEQLAQNNWPIDRYINVYFINKFSANYVAGTIGNNNLTMIYSCFSPSISTFAHEMGHYFNLWHVFGQTGVCDPNTDCVNQGDFVCDTPPILASDFGSVSSCVSGDASNSTLNFMGYNGLQNRFTAGQKDRMRAALYGYAWGLVTSDALIPTTVGNELSLDAIENPSSINLCGSPFVPQVTLRNLGANTVNTVTVETYIDGVLKSTTNLSGLNITSRGSRTVNLNSFAVATGTRTIKCIITKVNGVSGDYFTLNNEVCGSIGFYNNQFSINYNSYDCFITTTGSNTCGSLYTITATVLDTNRHEFYRWTENNTTISTVAVHSFIVQSDRDFFAEVKDRIYLINVSSNSNEGSVSVTGNKTYNSAATIIATESYGYIFLYWKDENGVIISNQKSYSFIVTKNKGFTAYFQPKIFSVVAVSQNINQGTVITQGTGAYATSYQVVVRPKNGYRFVEWRDSIGNYVSSDTAYTFTVTGNIRLTAYFTAVITSITNTQVHSVAVFPNPAVSFITIKDMIPRGQNVSIVDMTGRIVLSENFTNNTIDLSLLPPGVYTLWVRDDDQVYTTQLVKQ